MYDMNGYYVRLISFFRDMNQQLLFVVLVLFRHLTYNHPSNTTTTTARNIEHEIMTPLIIRNASLSGSTLFNRSLITTKDEKHCLKRALMQNGPANDHK